MPVDTTLTRKINVFLSLLILPLIPVLAQGSVAADPERMEQRIKALSEFGANADGGVDRVAFSEADIAGRAYKHFDLARKTGRDVAEPDRYAVAQLKEDQFPNSKLLKARLYTDGGYYIEAETVLKSVKESDLKTEKERVEYNYRKARLADKMGDLKTAKTYYLRTLSQSGTNPWYFAPNSALQLGYIARTRNDKVNAKKYFELALSFQKHAYKNSIDSKAKSALDQIAN